MAMFLLAGLSYGMKHRVIPAHKPAHKPVKPGAHLLNNKWYSPYLLKRAPDFDSGIWSKLS